MKCEITELIPQKYPFVMVDKLVSVEQEKCISIYKIKRNNVFFYINTNGISEIMLIENVAQTCAAHLGYHKKNKNEEIRNGYIGNIKNLKLYGNAKINEILKTIIVIDKKILNVTIINAQVFVKDKLIMECEMRVFLDE